MRSKSSTLIQLSIWGILTACLATLILVGVGVPADLSLFVGCGATLVAMVFAIIETFLNDELNEN